MKVWIDSLTPKQSLFFAPLHKLLSSERHQVLVTTRRYREAEQTLHRLGLQYSVVGTHGGGIQLDKLVASGERIVRLAQLIGEWKPDVAVSFSSVEASRVAFGLAFPHVAVNDSPHSWMVARLTIPLSSYVGSPWIIKKSVWTAFGAPKAGIFNYRALDPAAWLKRHHPNRKVLDELGLDRDRPIVVFRTEEAFASYLSGLVRDDNPVVGPVMARLLEESPDIQLVVSTRYGRQAPVLRRRFGRKAIVLDRIIDAASLLSYTTVFVGSGGTMTVEAALLGVATISCFPGPKPLYIRYLEGKGLVRTIRNPTEIARETVALVKDEHRRDSQKKRGTELLEWMEDPAVKIHKVVKKAQGNWMVNH